MSADDSATMPAAEVDVDEDLVRSLLTAAATDQGLDADLAARPLHLVANGWDNTMFRLGRSHVVRLPRREVAVPLVVNEQRWLPTLAPRLPLPVPVPVFAGAPARGEEKGATRFLWPWSILPWFEGTPLGTRQPAGVDGDRLIDDLSTFLNALHGEAPPDAPRNPVRGVPLASRSERTEPHLVTGSTVLGADDSGGRSRLRRHWADAVAAPPWSGSDRWLHGDLHPLNMLWTDPEPRRTGAGGGGRLSAVIDFGDITAGDPATDFAVAWYLFPDRERRARFQDSARLDGRPVDPATWCRARGWALSMAAALVANSADHPTLDRLGRRTLAAVAADTPN